MVPTYNGWEDTPEDEREALEQWEAEHPPGRRSMGVRLRRDSSTYWMTRGEDQ
jgi:hypothetical protein